MENKIIKGDCIQCMQSMQDNSVDAIVTDPPYGLEFMGKDWDKFGKAQNIGGGTMKNRNTPFQRGDKTPPAYYIWTNKQKHEMQHFFQEFAIEALRVLKPGGFLLAFGGSRTYHRLACGIEDAGFEIRDQIMWLYGSGFPKSLNIGKQIDKMGEEDVEVIKAKKELGKWLKGKRGDKPQKEISKHFLSKTGGLTGCVTNWELGFNLPTWETWVKLKELLELDNSFDYLIVGRPTDYIPAEREVIGSKNKLNTYSDIGYSAGEGNYEKTEFNITAPSTPEAKEWEGWGTALKPAHEPIVVARKPLAEKNVALNVLKWGTGGINIDACRIGTDKLDKNWRVNPSVRNKETEKHLYGDYNKHNTHNLKEQGRFPANIILDEEAGKMLDEQSGVLGQGHWSKTKTTGFGEFGNGTSEYFGVGEKDKTKHGASRFFYCAKASKSERNFGMEEKQTTKKYEVGEPVRWNKGGVWTNDTTPAKNNHPTVKPIKLMEYLIKLVSKEGAVVLDPFLGSGTTGIACAKLNRQFIGIEKEEEYVKIAEARIKPFLQQRKL